MNTIHLWRSYDVEVGTGKPGYRWVSGYSMVCSKTTTIGPFTLANWRGMAKRDNEKIKIHRTFELAYKAAVTDA